MKQEKSSNKAIELFTGSKTQLEELTGETFKVMKDKHDQLIMVDGNYVSPQGTEYPWSIGMAKERLRKKARELGADALTHVNYLFPSRSRGNSEVYAEGYAVQKIKVV